MAAKLQHKKNRLRWKEHCVQWLLKMRVDGNYCCCCRCRVESLRKKRFDLIFSSYLPRKGYELSIINKISSQSQPSVLVIYKEGEGLSDLELIANA